MAGVARFELANDGVKVRCLTAWLYPNNLSALLFYPVFILNTRKTYHSRLLTVKFTTQRSLATSEYARNSFTRSVN